MSNKNYTAIIRKLIQATYDTSGPQSISVFICWDMFELATALNVHWLTIKNKGLLLEVSTLLPNTWMSLPHQDQFNKATETARMIWEKDWDEEFDDDEPTIIVKCECGSHACGSSFHSSWCPLYNLEGVKDDEG